VVKKGMMGWLATSLNKERNNLSTLILNIGVTMEHTLAILKFGLNGKGLNGKFQRTNLRSVWTFGVDLMTTLSV